MNVKEHKLIDWFLTIPLIVICLLVIFISLPIIILLFYGILYLICGYLIKKPIHSFMLKYRKKKIQQLITQNNQNQLIKLANKLTDSYKWQDEYLLVAIYCLKNKDFENFKKFIYKVEKKDIIMFRYYFETVKNIFDGDWEDAEKNYKLFLESPKEYKPELLKFADKDLFLSGCLAYHHGEDEIAFEKLSKVKEETKNTMTKNICIEILNKIQSKQSRLV